jgi:hypothetical protein
MTEERQTAARRRTLAAVQRLGIWRCPNASSLFHSAPKTQGETNGDYNQRV